MRGSGSSLKAALTVEQAEGFYYVHKERAFFNDLVTFMTSGPIVVQVLEGEDAIQKNRDLMGATNPANADDYPQGLRGERGSQFSAWFRAPETATEDRIVLANWNWLANPRGRTLNPCEKSYRLALF